MGSAVGKQQSKRRGKLKSTDVIECHVNSCNSQKKVNFGDGDANENKVSKQEDSRVNHVSGCFGFLPDRRIIKSRRRNQSELFDDDDPTIQYMSRSTSGKGRSKTNSDALPEISPRRPLPQPRFRPKRVSGNPPRSNLTPSKSSTLSNKTTLPPIHRSPTSFSTSQIDSLTTELSNNNISDRTMNASSEGLNSYQPLTPITHVKSRESTPIGHIEDITYDNDSSQDTRPSSPRSCNEPDVIQTLETNVSDVSNDNNCKIHSPSDNNVEQDALVVDEKEEAEVDTLANKMSDEESVLQVKDCEGTKHRIFFKTSLHFSQLLPLMV